ncbi:hypothetical protein SDC9_159457 [bioreactor metagenome]|uniref:Uncharacterized protein n=1 Tax=bioreactor metagenome TaxID=1076179 RepID=A0A645FCP1_9ZZZZ
MRQHFQQYQAVAPAGKSEQHPVARGDHPVAGDGFARHPADAEKCLAPVLRAMNGLSGRNGGCAQDCPC